MRSSQRLDCALRGVAGVESEMELAFAALQQLCAPMLDDQECLPDPQRDALGHRVRPEDGRRPRTGFSSSVAEAAETLSVPQGTVKSRIHYALHALRQAIDDQGGLA